jgi:hypothetical protein
VAEGGGEKGFSFLPLFAITTATAYTEGDIERIRKT